MSTTISLISIPNEAHELLSKAKERGKSDEYSSVFFSIKSALEGKLNTYGHKDWIEFKSDVENLQTHYPNKMFEEKYIYDTNSRYEILEYLIMKYEGQILEPNKRIELIIFKGEQECECQGRNFEYWDNAQLKNKLEYVNSIDSEKLFNEYIPTEMKTKGIYQMERGQNEIDLIRKLYLNLKTFLNESNKLNGYTLILNS